MARFVSRDCAKATASASFAGSRPSSAGVFVAQAPAGGQECALWVAGEAPATTTSRSSGVVDLKMVVGVQDSRMPDAPATEVYREPRVARSPHLEETWSRSL